MEKGMNVKEESQNSINLNKADNSTLALQYKFSAQELGKLMNTDPNRLLEVDLAYQTGYFDVDFIEDMLDCVNDLDNVRRLVSLIVSEWQRLTLLLYPHVGYRDRATHSKKPYVEDLDKKLEALVGRMTAERATLSKCKETRLLFGQHYAKGTATASLGSGVVAAPAMTTVPSYPRGVGEGEGGAKRLLLGDLTPEAGSKVLVSQAVFDVLVRQLNDDVWPFVQKNKGAYCDLIRFVLIKREVLAGDTTREQFDALLHQVVAELKDEGSLLSSLTRCKATSSKEIKHSLKCYDHVDKKRRDEVWQLINDCKPVEERLEPVFEAMELERSVARNPELAKEAVG